MKTVLFIRYKKPFGIKEGGEQGTHKNYLIFCELFGKEQVEEYYVHPNLENETIFDKIFGFAYMLKGYYFGLTSRKIDEICKIAANKDFIFIDRSVFGIIAKKLKESGYKGKIITFFHNVEKLYFKARISPFAPYRFTALRCIDQNDRYSLQYSDKTLSINERDAEVLQTLYDKKVDMIVPVTFVDRHPATNTLPLSKPPICLFLGAYFPANVDGILWFIENVLPAVNIKIQIVGKGMDKIRSQIKNPHIQIFSDVPDLEPLIAEADFMLLPIFKGSGMKVKTCEALMFGKNIIGTPEAFEGYDLNFSKVGACCTNKEEFIAAIVDLQQKDMKKFNTYSRNFYLEHHTHEIALNQMKTLLASS